MEKIKNQLIIIPFLIFIFGIPFINLLKPEQSFSEIENRPLQQFPTFTWQRLANGRFMEEFETYKTDQFMMKERWVGLKSDIERLAQRQENNGVYFGDNGFLLEVFLDEGQHFSRNLSLINTFNERTPELETTVMLVPTAVKIFEDKLPPFAPILDQGILLEEAESTLTPQFVNVVETLKNHREEEIFFRTDHHWTMRGAKHAYHQLMKSWNRESFNDYEIKIISDSFYGTHYARANNFHLPPDSVELFLPQADVNFTLQRGPEGEVVDSLFDFDFLERRDQYAFFLGGVGPLKIIRSDVASEEKLVMFIDSFAHNFIPFLAMHFKEIHVIDLRYFNANPYTYLEEHEFDKALFLYNLSSFGEDPSLARLR